MSQQHLKGYNIPVNWPVSRKKTRYVAKPSPGPHNGQESIILNLIVQEFLKYAKTAREVRKILNLGKIKVNGVVVKDPKRTIGLFDIIEIPDTNETYRIIFGDNKRYHLEKIKESGSKLCKIQGKTMLRGNKTQLNLSGGRNIIISKDTYKVGDTVVFDLKKKAIVKHVKFEKGAKVYLSHGRNAGAQGTLEEVNNYPGMRKSDIKIKTKTGHIQTLKAYAVAVDETIGVSK